MNKVRKAVLERYEAGGIQALTESECFSFLSGEAVGEGGAMYLTDAIAQSQSPEVKLAYDIFVRTLEQKLERKKFCCRSSKEVFDYLFASMRLLNKEVFKVMYLDVKNNLIAVKTEFEGSLTSTSIYPRQIIIEALKHKAAALIFSHNHPSGETEPSDADREITKSLIIAGSVMEMKVLDHIVVGNNRYFSFADNGLIREYELASRLNKKP